MARGRTKKAPESFNSEFIILDNDVTIFLLLGSYKEKVGYSGRAMNIKGLAQLANPLFFTLCTSCAWMQKY
jgi:hypothetical protein